MAASALLALLVASQPTPPPREPLAVVTSVRGDRQQALRIDAPAAAGLGFRLNGVEIQPFENVNRQDAARTCGHDARCLKARLKSAGYTSALATIVDPTLDPTLAVVRFINLKTGVTMAEGLATATSTVHLPDQVRRTVQRLADEQKWQPAAKVVITTAPEDAAVSLSAANTKLTLQKGAHVAAGQYQLHVEKEEWKPIERTVVLSPDEYFELSVEMEPEEPSIWPWIAIGAGAVIAGGIAAGVVLSSRDREVAFCIE